MSIESFFNTEFVKLQSTETADGRGGDSVVWSATSVEYFGYIRLAKADERVTDEANSLTAQHIHRYPIGVTLVSGDRIRRKSDSKDFDVIYPESKHGHHNKTNLVEVTV
jgi:hypothetical protein